MNMKKQGMISAAILVIVISIIGIGFYFDKSPQISAKPLGAAESVSAVKIGTSTAQDRYEITTPYVVKDIDGKDVTLAKKETVSKKNLVSQIAQKQKELDALKVKLEAINK